MAIDLVRDAAIDVLLRVSERGVHLDVSLDKTLSRKRISERGRRFLTHLVYGTVRHQALCDHVLGPLLHQPFAKLPRPMQLVLRMGVYQALFCDNVTFPAMVHTSVDLAKKRGHAGTARLANAVLKRVPQSLDDVKLPARDDVAAFLTVRYSMPDWLVRRWIAENGAEQTEALCAALNEVAPATLRANTLKTSADDLIEQLKKAGYPASKETEIPEEVTVTGPLPPARANLFREGFFMVQDPASMLPAHLLEPKAGEKVLDMCAAPGGKSTHVAQLAGGEACVVALDRQPYRMGRIAENMERLQTPGVYPLCGDAAHAAVQPGFDRVLLDPPCSGLGTLRRHPDMKWRVDQKEIVRLAGLQGTLLREAIDLCKNSGVIVYSVCTTTPEETAQVVESVLEEGRVEPGEGPAWLDKWKVGNGMYRTSPADDGLDGFFLMRLRKRS